MNKVYRKVTQLILSVVLIGNFGACQNETKQETIVKHEGKNIFADDFMAQIHTHKDLRHTKWLTDHLETKEKSQLSAIFNALASGKDSTAFAPLLDRLQKDDIDESMFLNGMNALGNLKSNDATSRLIAFLQSELNEAEKNATYTSIGKLGSESGFDFLLDQNTSSGVMAGLYRSFLQGNKSIAAIEKAIDGIAQPDKSTRFWSSHLLVRQRDEDLTAFLPNLIEAYKNEQDHEVKIALARTFRKTMGQEKSTLLKNELSSIEEPLVLVNLIGSLGETDYADCHKQVQKLLSHDSEQVATSASSYLKRNIEKVTTGEFKTIVEQIKNPTIKGHIYQMILSKEPENSSINNKLIQLFDDAKNVAQKSSLIRNIAANKNNLDWIKTLLNNKEERVFQGIAHECVLQMVITDEERLEYIDMGIASENVAMICQSAGSIRETENSSEADKWVKNMRARIDKLSLPREMEALVEMRKSIAHCEKSEAEKYTPEYNHPMNWDIISDLPDRPLIKLKTTKGIIKWELYLDKIPAAVSTIVNLIDSGFYDNKIFHRVVPNFVAQGGCPRGDGWGSLDFTLRSEYDNEITYETGAIGLASAGEDTESCQFFMCHSPTPHLDNRYTIIGKVIEGLDVLNKIGLGDEIITMKRLN